MEPRIGPRIGIALGSGSARGWAHIGILEALSEAGIEPEIVCGTSIGALVGAAYAGNRLEELHQWGEALTWREIVRLLDLRLRRGGLIDGRAIIAFMHRLRLDMPIETLPKRYAAVATDLATGKEVVFGKGPVDAAIRASIALPGIFSPVLVEGRWMLDGGLVNPVPVSVCRALGADFVIAVNLNSQLVGRRFTEVAGTRRRNGRPEILDRLIETMPAAFRQQAPLEAPAEPKPVRSPDPGYFDVLANSINIMQEQITNLRLAAETPEMLLSPQLRDIGLLEFNRAEEAIAEGRATAERALPDLRRKLGLQAKAADPAARNE